MLKKELSEVKAQLAKLKKAFEKMSQQNMQLTMDLATERERIRQLQTEVQSTSLVRGGSDDGTSTLKLILWGKRGVYRSLVNINVKTCNLFC